MELAIYFATLQGLLDIEDALHLIDPNTLPTFIETIIFGDDINSREYYGHLLALTWMETLLEREGEYSRVYFGQEFCEYLIPEADEVEQAYYCGRQLGWEFTYVTGYVTDDGLVKVRRNLQRLASIEAACEVVVNDWGVLRVLQNEFAGFEPVLGRFLNKQVRLGRFNRGTTPPPVNTEGIESAEDTIRQHQIAAFRDIDLANPAWREDIRALGIRQADMDMTPQGVNHPPGGWPDLRLGYYYPWGYLAGGRNCMTAGAIEPEREFVALDSPCSKPCRLFNKTARTDHFPEITIQRGNSVFVFHGEYATRYFADPPPFQRLIFEPYIPI